MRKDIGSETLDKNIAIPVCTNEKLKKTRVSLLYYYTFSLHLSKFSESCLSRGFNQNTDIFQPVNMYPATRLGFHDVFGNVWEWTEDHFNGLPGITSDPLYDDFSSPCFDGRHNVMMVI
mgnify:CR=1 FL=1